MSRYPVFYSTPPELRDIVVQTFEWPKFWVQMEKKTHPSRTNQNRHGQESEVGGVPKTMKKVPKKFQNIKKLFFSKLIYIDPEWSCTSVLKNIANR